MIPKMRIGKLTYYLESGRDGISIYSKLSLISFLKPTPKPQSSIFNKMEPRLLTPLMLSSFPPAPSCLPNPIPSGFMLPASMLPPFPVAAALVQARISWFLCNCFPLCPILHTVYTPCRFISNTSPHVHHLPAGDLSALGLVVSHFSMHQNPHRACYNTDCWITPQSF